MPKRIRAAHVSDIPADGGIELALEGKIVAIYRIGDEFYAMDGICPHAGGPLGKGTLDAAIVTCPWHGWQFDVREGQHCLTPQIRQTTYDLELDNEEIFVFFPDS